MPQYTQRVETCCIALQKLQMDALLVIDPINLYYLTGLSLSCGQLLVHRHGALLSVDGRYFEAVKNSSSSLQVRRSEEATLATILEEDNLSYIAAIAIDEEVSHRLFCELEEQLRKTCTKKLTAIPSPLYSQRAIKDNEELDRLREAAALGSSGYDYVCSLLKEGISEKELAIALEIFWKKKGAQGPAFEPIIAFGANSSMPHYRSGAALLKKGDSVLIDIGVKYNSYCSDMTRVVFFGEVDDKIREIYEVVKTALERALGLCKAGVTAKELDSCARDIIASFGYKEYFTHSLGHGVGLEVHEKPALKSKEPYGSEKIEEGMVITIEPGIYLPGIGGVRLEECVIVTKQGYENLTNRPLNPCLS